MSVKFRPAHDVRWLILFAGLSLFVACGDDEPAQPEAVVEQTQSAPAAPVTDPALPATNEPEIAAQSEDDAAAIEEEEEQEEVETATIDKPVAGKTHTINAQARIFKPEIIYINPGDTVQWINMTSHNTVSVDELLPQGATPWSSDLGENLKLKLDIEGIYPYVCVPHIGFGMVGVIVVGKPDNLEEVKSKATTVLQGPYRRMLGKLNKVVIP